MLTSPLNTCNSVPIIDRQLELPGVKEVVTSENWEVQIECVSQCAISRQEPVCTLVSKANAYFAKAAFAALDRN